MQGVLQGALQGICRMCQFLGLDWRWWRWKFVDHVLKELDLKGICFMVGQLVVKDDTGTECSFEITVSHQYPIPDGSYTLLGTTDKSSNIHWVIGRRLLDRRLRKLSVAQMNVEVASMDSLVSRSIAKRASITILA